MARRPSNAPPPIEPISGRGRRPQSKPAVKIGPPAAATSVSALMAHDRFRRAARECKQLLDRAYNVEKIDEVRWTSEVQRWQIVRDDAEFYASKCKSEGLPDY